MDRRMEDRFIVRPDSAGFSVIDTQIGQPAVIAMARQKGLSEADAEHTASLLNARAQAELATL